MKTIVTTKTELLDAKDKGFDEIEVQGELADKLKKTKKITKLSAVALGAITALVGVGTVSGPATGGISTGVSYLSAAAVASYSGVEVAAIITAATLGIGFILALFLGYEEIEYSKGKLVLRKRQKH